MRQGIQRSVRLLADRQSSLSVSYLVYTLALGFSGAVQLGLLFLLARLLPTADFGIVTLLMVSIPLAARFVTLGSDIGLSIRIWKRPRDEQQADLSAVLTWTTINTAIVVLLGVVVGAFTISALHPFFFVCAILAAACRNCTEAFQLMLRREGRVALVGLVVVIRAILIAAACVAAVVVIGGTAFAYLVGLLVAEGLAALATLVRFQRLYSLRFGAPESAARMRELVRVGFPAIPVAVAALLLAAGDRFVITALLGLGATGVYALGQRLAESLVQILFIPFTTAFNPHTLSIASEDQEQAFGLIGKSTLLFAYLGGGVVGLPVIFSREVILAFAGPEYAPAATVFLLVIAGVLVFQLSQILGTYFTHTEQLRKYMWIIIAAATGNLALNIFAVQVAGILGAAIVSLLMYEAVLIAMALTASRSGNPLVSLFRLHVPLFLFFAYLLVIFQVDSQDMKTAPAVLAKVAVWAGYMGICLALSREARGAVSAIPERFRMLLTS